MYAQARLGQRCSILKFGISSYACSNSPHPHVPVVIHLFRCLASCSNELIHRCMCGIRCTWQKRFALFLTCICYVFVRVCLLMPCGYLLGKG